MPYQHTVIDYNYETGVRVEGVFKTAQEAAEFAKAYPQASYGSEMGTKVYGIFHEKFNPDLARDCLTEWLGDYQISGRD